MKLIHLVEVHICQHIQQLHYLLPHVLSRHHLLDSMKIEFSIEAKPMFKPTNYTVRLYCCAFIEYQTLQIITSLSVLLSACSLIKINVEIIQIMMMPEICIKIGVSISQNSSAIIVGTTQGRSLGYQYRE